MHNELLTIGPVTVYGYGLMIAIGIIVAYMLGEKRAVSQKLSPEPIFSFLIWVCISGFTGSKILFCITDFNNVFRSGGNIWDNIKGGWVVYGKNDIFFIWQ